MPRTQTHGTKRKEKSDSDEEQTPRTSSGSVSSQAGPNTDELEHLINDCVYYLLIADQKKQAIKKADIVKHVLKEHSKYFSSVITRVQTILKQVYGIKLFELEGKKGHYILCNNLKESLTQMARTNSDTEISRDGLLIIVLSLIFMNGNVIIEVHLWQTLKRLGLDIEGPPHPVFGDVKKLIVQEYVRQLYLEYTRIQGSDPPSFEFRWGPRATVEVDKQDILELVCVIFNNDMTIEQWTSQYQDMLRSKESVAST